MQNSNEEEKMLLDGAISPSTSNVIYSQLTDYNCILEEVMIKSKIYELNLACQAIPDPNHLLFEGMKFNKSLSN